MFFTLQDYLYSRTSDLLGAFVDRYGDSVTLEGQANLKGSRERRAELGVALGDGTSKGVPKEGGEVRSLTEERE